MEPEFASRSNLPELMDEPGVPETEIAKALRELDIIGKRLGGYTVTINSLTQIMKRSKISSILDIGFGGGDTLREVARWAKKAKLDLQLSGVDRNPLMAQYAAAHSQAFPHIRYCTADVFDDALLQYAPDIVMSSLFCHHFDNAALIKLLQRQLSICRTAVIVNDLHRHPIAYYAIKTITRLFSKSYLVKHDGPLSVARAFIRRDWESILSAAGIREYSLKWRWAWRWQLIIPKQELQPSAQNG